MSDDKVREATRALAALPWWTRGRKWRDALVASRARKEKLRGEP
jgi:hypothetical protein